MIRKIFLALVLAALAAGGVLWWITRPAPILTVTSWAGSYGQAQDRAMMRPFAAAHGVDVRLSLWDGDLAELAKAISAHTWKGDVIDFELPAAIKACEQGLLEKIDTAALPPGADGTPAAQDFVPGAIGPCWVGSAVYSRVIAAAPKRFDAPPARLADFFDTERFPGQRALSGASPKYNLEMVLLADGVAPAAVYAQLSTPQGLNRAFAKLAALHPLWTQGDADAMARLESGQVVMAAVLNGDIFDASRRGFAPDVIWDHQLYELDVFAIPAGNPNRKRALAFIAFATGTGPLAQTARWLPYGPARFSAFGGIGENPDLKISMTPFQPTTHFGTAMAVDDRWWAAHITAIMPRWRALVATP